MKRRSSRRGSLASKGRRLKREAFRTAKSAAGLTPLGSALTYYDLARQTPRLVRAAGDYANSLVDTATCRVRRAINR